MSPRHMIKFSIATILAAAASQAVATEAAAPPDTSEWACSACPFDKGGQADVTAGAIYGDGANAASGRFTGIDRQSTYIDAASHASYVNEKGQFASYSLDNLGLDSRTGTVKFGRYGHYDVALKYDGQPFRRYDTAVTPFSGGMSQTLPSEWTAAGSTLGMTELDAALHDVKIGTLRKTYGVSGRWFPHSGMQLFASFERQNKSGTQIVGAGFLTQALQLAAPVNFQTDTFEVGAAWSGKGGSLRISAADSKFRNDDPLLTFQNPYLSLVENLASVPNGAVSRPPENEARSVNITGSITLPLNSSVSFATGFSTIKQSAALVPVTSQPDALPPAEGFDGDVRLQHYALTLGSRPWSRLHLHGRIAYDERGDYGNAMALTQYLTDLVAGPTVTTPRFDFVRVRVDGGADVRLSKYTSIGVGGDRVEINRTQQLVRHTEDGRTYGKVKWAPGAGFALTLKGGAAHRDARGIDLTYLPVGQNPLVSMFNLSNRDREFGDLDMVWSPNEKLSITLQGSLNNDKYGRSVMGLLEGREQRGAGSITWSPNEKLSLYIDGGYQSRETLQAGAYSTASASWEAKINDKFRNIGGGLKYSAERWEYAIDVAHATSVGETSSGLVGGLAPFPELNARYDNARVTVGYTATERLGVRLRYVYQKYSSLDWALDGVGPATVPNLLAMGYGPDHYNASVLGLSFTYKYGTLASP